MNLRGGDNMGILYDLFGRPKKRCTMCGCNMYDDSDSDICEVCLDELYESDPGDIIIPFNYRRISDGICPTITTRPEGLKTMILVVEEVSDE